MTTEWWWLEGCRRSPRRDPREDDPEWYRDRRGEWVKRTAWSADVFPQTSEEYMRYLEETTSQHREAIVAERMRRQGLVRWHSSWVTPGRAEELEAKFQKGLQRDRNALAEARATEHSYRVFWC